MVVETRRDECVVKVLNSKRTKDVVKMDKIEKFTVDNRQMLGQSRVSFVIFCQILEKLSFKIISFLLNFRNGEMHTRWR